jgi:hypothetical protein
VSILKILLDYEQAEQKLGVTKFWKNANFCPKDLENAGKMWIKGF